MLDPDINRTVEAVLNMEGGDVIHEHYDFEFYIHRRGAFLGQFAEESHVRKGCFPIARRDAQLVFDHEKQELSIQEVRRRELAKGLDPLLPLPTTANTQTIDSYASYPDQEWGTQPRADSPSSAPQGPFTGPPRMSGVDINEATQSNHAKPVTSEEAAASTTGLSTLDYADLLAEVPTVNPQAIAPPAPVTVMVPSTTTQHLLHAQEFAGADSQSQKYGPSIASGGHSSSSSQPSAQASSVPLTSSMSQTTESDGFAIENPLLAASTESLRAAAATPQAPDSITVSGGVSALAGRGMRLPVKQQKRTAAESHLDDDDRVNGNDDLHKESVVPPRKKIKSSDDRIGPDAAPKKISKKPVASDDPEHLEAVVRGEKLPHDRKEAVRASKERHSRL